MKLGQGEDLEAETGVARHGALELAASQISTTKTATTDPYKWPCLALVLSALLFNFVLCFINTQITAISTVHVMAAELLIVSMAFLVSFCWISWEQLALISAVLLYLLFLVLARALGSPDSSIDLKVIRDVMIPIAFFLLGARVRELESADTIVLISTTVVTVVSLFEYVFVDLYLKYFNIIMYYVARGSVAVGRLEILSTSLFESGIRPEGRVLLPILGDHRISSIFLEPVSPGNFAMIVFFWAMVRSRFRRYLSGGLFLMAIFLIIMADNRFGAFLCGVAIGVSLLPIGYASALVASLPLVGLFFLFSATYMFEGFIVDNSLLGRLVSSGRFLATFEAPDWLGVGQLAPLAFDSGYGYVISQVGVLGSVVFWLMFVTLRSKNREFHVFRSLTGLYLAAILCVSYSPFTIKTAALLWFLLGALAIVSHKHDKAIDAGVVLV
jgi:putative polymerase